MSMSVAESLGDHLRSWRKRRRMSQLDLALEAGISQRHLSFVESGRSQPSRDMVLTLGHHLSLQPREQNRLLHAAGFAPVFTERSLDDPALAAARKAVDQVLSAHDPFPALAVDRYWTLVTANDIAAALMAGAAPVLLEPPVNVLRLSLHPDGLAPAIVNYAEWREHVLRRLEQQIEGSADPHLVALHEELSGYAAPQKGLSETEPNDVYVPLRLSSGFGELSFLSTTTVFGSPIDITVSELAIEAFFPADEDTAAALRNLADSRGDRAS